MELTGHILLGGGIHGIAQIVENHIKINKDSKTARFFSWIFVFVFCNVAWVFFRAGTIKEAFYVIETLVKDLAHPTLFLHNTIGLREMDLCCIVFSLLILAIVDYISEKKDVIKLISKQKPVVRWSIYLVMTWLILFFMKPIGTSEFVYFQF